MIASATSGKQQFRRSGFTLIELLVVISIIALLMSILIPSMRKARDHAKEVACGALLHGLGNGLGNYLLENNDWIPGMNTSGAGLRSLQMVGSGDPDSYENRRLPVQPTDWLSPIIDEPNLSNNRAERFKFLLEHYKCPAQENFHTIAYPQSNAWDKDDFENAKFTWTTVSYLMPVHFQYWGQRENGETILNMKKFPMVHVAAKAAPADWEVKVDSFKSKLQRIGNPGDKVFIADGTRYLDESGVLDFDYSMLATGLTSFTGSGAWWAGSTAYGVRSGSEAWDEIPRTVTPNPKCPSDGKNLRLSYRHSSHERFDGAAQNNFGMMNALFFDGHVKLMNDQNSRELKYWYPRGAVVQKPDQGMTKAQQNEVVR